MTTKDDNQNDPNHGQRVTIHRLPTGVRGLDEILGAPADGSSSGDASTGGGGLPEYSFNILAGAPGSGKTTLAHQIMFANASSDTPALYFTILGEPAIKMLRYQQQFSFFDRSKVDGAIRFINLSQVVMRNDLGAVLDTIVKEVEDADARIVIVDSFRTVIRRVKAMERTTAPGEMELQGFVQRLALHLTSWQATSFLVGEYVEAEMRDNPVFTVADGLLWLYQAIERNSVVRKLQVMKLRGQESVPGLHTFRITSDGLQCFPRTFGLVGSSSRRTTPKGRTRLSTGIPTLDTLMSGGIPEGDSLLIAGASGTGKSMFATHYIHEGIKRGEPGVVAIFEEIPEEYLNRASDVGLDMRQAVEDGALKLLYLRPLDLSVDETVHEIVSAVRKIDAKRVVIDSLVGFEMALAPGFRDEFRESLYRMIGALVRLGVTVVSTVEVEDDFTSMGLSQFGISCLADDIIRLRYVSIEGQLRKMLVVIKMRGSTHSIDMHELVITSKGIGIGESFRGLRGLTSGIPEPWVQPLGTDAHSGRPSDPPPRTPSGKKASRKRDER